MANKKYGILLTAKDEASKVIKKLGTAMGASTKAVKTLGTMGVKAFNTLGVSIVVANQALELGKKAFGALYGAVSTTITAFKELRGESHPLVRELAGIQTQFTALKAAIGTSFAAAIVAVSKAFKPLILSSLKFLDNNRKLIATKIVQFLFKMAQALNEGIASAVSTVHDLWSTWNVSIDQSIVSVSKWLATFKVVSQLMGGIPGLLGKSIPSFKNLGNASKEAQLRIDTTTNAHGEFADEIERVKSAIAKLIAEGYKPAVAAAKVLADAAGETGLETTEQGLMRLRDQAFDLIPTLDKVSFGLTKGMNLDEGRTAFEKFERRFDRVNRMLGIAGPKSIKATRDELQSLYKDFTGQELDIDIDLNNIEAAKEAIRIFADTAEVSLLDAKEAFMIFHDELEQTITLEKRMGEAFTNSAQIIASSGDILIDVFTKIADGTYDMASGMFVMLSSLLKAIIETVRNTILAYAAETAAAQYKKTALLPGNIIIGSALAAMALTAVGALLDKVPGALQADAPKRMHRGGIVTGVGNQDTVPAMLTPGEMVIPADVTKDLLRRQGFNKGGIVSRDTGAGVVVNFNEASIMPRSPAEMERFVRDDLVPVLNRLKRKGAFA